jgi:hypothetical protein
VFQLLALLVGSGLGFFASKALRKPKRRSSSAPVPAAAAVGGSGVAAASVASVGRSVGGALGRRKGLTPPDLQRACLSEMIRHVQPGPGGTQVVPHQFVLRMHPDDVATVDEGRGWFVNGLADALRDAAQAHGWTLAGSPDITVEADPSRKAGVPAALAVAPNAPASDPTPPPAPRPIAAADPGPAGSVGDGEVALVRTDTNQRVPLTGNTVTIGRGSDRTITVDDSRVSRAHASLHRKGQVWSVTDDGSSNGTRVNGTELAARDPRTLHPGDLIEVGPVGLRFEAPHPPPTRTLSDGDRTRISGEVLPPREPGPSDPPR